MNAITLLTRAGDLADAEPRIALFFGAALLAVFLTALFQPVTVAEPGGGRLRLQTDHVLGEMLRGLGCTVAECTAPFQPEAGAYGAHGGHHGHDAEPGGDLHDPGHGPHRSVPKIHQFKPAPKP